MVSFARAAALVCVLIIAGHLILKHVAPPLRVIAIHMGAHDNTVAIAHGGEVLLVLELERIFGVRYFEKSHDQTEFVNQWKVALDVIRNSTLVPNMHLPFDVAVVGHAHANATQPWMLETLKTIIRAKEWREEPHSLSHAVHGFYDSGFESALVVVADADERDGAFSVWWASRREGVRLGKSVALNLALAYEFAAASLKEMNSGRPEERCWKDHPLHCNKYAGTLMGYAALGQPTDGWKRTLRPLFETAPAAGKAKIMAEFPKPTDEKEQRDLAASAQSLLEDMLIEQLEKVLREPSAPKVEGIVLTGDLALNVKSNSAVQRYFDKPVHVPSAPGDDGIPIGCAWLVAPPQKHTNLMYLGLHPADIAELPALAKAYNARTVSIQEVADLLAAQKVVGVIHGRQEVGPRALGHRSLLAAPTTMKMKDRLNKIKERQWFRPVAPTMAEECAPRLFAEKRIVSPFMSFAPRLNETVKDRFPAIYHFDGTARPQTVTPAQNPWLHKLLLAVGTRIGEPVVINTSFNTKGRPIINTIAEALELLQKLDDLDYVLVEDYLFKKST
eukprot:TRINITY_DN16103_c0_g1_i1.p1 TRINITY_DN16103_c0_g1~~TRINITY_DN16103_c0_g1_i1.p1  ORF type:complete len:569 (+),score=116.20 TRINITY_DN16103_c0_g1_i1:33-1709(+)